MLDGAQVAAVHDVGAVFVLGDFHVFTGAVRFFEVVGAVGKRMALLRVGQSLQRVGGEDAVGRGDEFALAFFGGAVRFVLPAAGVGAHALVGVAVVEVAGEQAAAGVGDAQGTMHEDFQLDVRAAFADFADFVQREFAREDDAADAVFCPEFDAGPVHAVRLHGEVDGHVGEGVLDQHDEAGIGHDAGVRPRFERRAEVADGGLQFVVVRHGVHGEVELLAQRVCLVDAGLQVFVVELVAAHAQGVTRRARIDGIRAVGKGVAHGFQGAGRGEEFGVSHKFSEGMEKARIIAARLRGLWHNGRPFSTE